MTLDVRQHMNIQIVLLKEAVMLVQSENGRKIITKINVKTVNQLS